MDIPNWKWEDLPEPTWGEPVTYDTINTQHILVDPLADDYVDYKALAFCRYSFGPFRKI